MLIAGMKVRAEWEEEEEEEEDEEQEGRKAEHTRTPRLIALSA